MITSKQTVPDIFKNIFKQKANKTFINFGNSQLNYGQLSSDIQKYTTYFSDRNIKAGDRVVISSRNETFICTFYLALLANGITVVLIDADSAEKRANSIIQHCKATFIFADKDILNDWNIVETKNQSVVPILENIKPGSFRKLLKKNSDAEKSFPALIGDLTDTELPNEIDPESDAYILFTSGTTADPKGVRISYRALFTHMATLSKVYQLGNSSIIFNNLILSHADGMIQGPILALFNSATLHRPFPFSIQKIEEIFDVIYRENITHWVMVPTMIALIYQFKQHDPDTLNNRSFRYVISCGGKLETMLWQNFESKFQTCIINGYGLTETVAGGLFAGPDHASHVIGTIGKPIDCEAKVMGDNNIELKVGEQGEIWLRGSLLMSGYLNNPEANSEVFVGDWFRTGDLGTLGEDGCFRITGRKKSVIISGGVNISPEEVTEVLNSHPGISSAVTFGLEHETWGEIVTCAIVKRDLSLSKEAVIAHCRKHLEERKVPTNIYFVDELPYGRSGKVIIQEIKNMITFSDREK